MAEIKTDASIDSRVSTDNSLNADPEDRVQRAEYRCIRQASDFNNVFKAFIGTSYLSFPFGFLQSGLILGCIVLSIVVVITGHCCHLIVDVKKYVLRQRCNIEDSEDIEDDPEYQRLARGMRFNDLGRICLGKTGPFIVDFFLVFTQIGFCVAYFIFIGNAIHDIVPLKAVHVNDSMSAWNEMDIPSGARLERDMNFNESNILPDLNLLDIGNSTVGPNVTDSNMTTSQPITVTPYTNISDTVYVSVMPDLKYLVLAPLLPFILFAFIRDVRHMGPWSLLANLAIICGYFTILSLMLIGFEISPDIEYFNWAKVPVFFGQVSCAFEGIGLVLPVEASMRDNAHNFSNYLKSTLVMVSCILASFGILGYMKYGPYVEQVITMNIPAAGIVPFTLSCTLILAVTLTFPLQVFPVIEISERYFLGVGKNDMHHKPDEEETSEQVEGYDNEGMSIGNSITSLENGDSYTREEEEEEEEEEERLLKNEGQVADWKRNILRVTIILVIAGLAVLLRDNFAYVSALIGAMGSTALGYVLPCLFHLKLCFHEIPWYVKAKDVLIMLFGVVGGVIGVIVVMQDIIASFS